MLKALIKKELLQMGSFYLYDNRTGRRRSKGASALYIALFAFMFITFFMMFLGFAFMLSEELLPRGLDWLFFSMMGLASIMFGVIGSVSTTHAILYRAKDNEALLALPIPPSKILASRMLVVFIFSLAIGGIPWLAGMVRYALAGANTGLSLLYQIILFFVLGALITVLNCILGWLVALLTRRIRNKTLATVLLSLVFLGAYLYVYTRINTIIRGLLAKLDEIAAALTTWGRPIRMLGEGASGEFISFLLFTLATFALFAALCAVLSATLTKILTYSHEGKKAVYREKREKQQSMFPALLRKEFKRFTGSSIYLLNTGLGVLIMLAGAVLAIVKADVLRSSVSSVLGPLGALHLVPVMIACAVGLVCSTDSITSCSVSLEGKRIWIIQSMPVPAAEALRAKECMHLLVNGVPAVIVSVVLAVIFGLSVLETAAVLAAVLTFVWFTAAFGLFLNLLKPNLSWTNEAAAVKQGLPSMFSLFAGWALAVIVFVICMLLSRFMGAAVPLLICAVLVGASSFILDGWIRTRGAQIFSHLS